MELIGRIGCCYCWRNQSVVSIRMVVSIGLLDGADCCYQSMDGIRFEFQKVHNGGGMNPAAGVVWQQLQSIRMAPDL